MVKYNAIQVDVQAFKFSTTSFTILPCASPGRATRITPFTCEAKVRLSANHEIGIPGIITISASFFISSSSLAIFVEFSAAPEPFSDLKSVGRVED